MVVLSSELNPPRWPGTVYVCDPSNPSGCQSAGLLCWLSLDVVLVFVFNFFFLIFIFIFFLFIYYYDCFFFWQ